MLQIKSITYCRFYNSTSLLLDCTFYFFRAILNTRNIRRSIDLPLYLIPKYMIITNSHHIYKHVTPKKTHNFFFCGAEAQLVFWLYHC